MKQLIKTLVIAVITCLSVFAFAQTERGEASYYNDKYHGKLTALGETYDKTAMTCAHRTHHAGTLLKVTRTDNNKSVTVRVNDRGPFKPGRIVDLSRAAAEQIDLITAGIAPVVVEVVNAPDVSAFNTPPTSFDQPATQPKLTTTPKATPQPKEELTARGGSSVASVPKPYNETPSSYNKIIPQEVVVKKTPAAPTSLPATESLRTEELPIGDFMFAPKTGYGVQVAAYARYDDAISHLAKLQKKWFKDVFLIVKKGSDGISRYGVIMGPFEDKTKATTYKANLKNKYDMDSFVLDLR